MSAMRTPEEIAQGIYDRKSRGWALSSSEIVATLMEAIETDRAQRGVATEREATELAITLQRVVAPSEVHDMVFGTGVLSWSWWAGAEFVSGPHSKVKLGRKELTSTSWLRIWEVADESTQRTMASMVPLSDIVSAAERLLREGRLTSDDVTEELGLVGAEDADTIIQLAVFGELRYS